MINFKKINIDLDLVIDPPVFCLLIIFALDPAHGRNQP